MPFQKGRQKTGGRTTKLKTQVKDFFKQYPYAVETLMKVLYEAGIDGDREAAMYIIDRQKGKPTAKIGLDEEDRELLKASTVVEFFKLIDSQKKLITEGDNGQEGTDQATGSALQE